MSMRTALPALGLVLLATAVSADDAAYRLDDPAGDAYGTHLVAPLWGPQAPPSCARTDLRWLQVEHAPDHGQSGALALRFAVTDLSRACVADEERLLFRFSYETAACARVSVFAFVTPTQVEKTGVLREGCPGGNDGVTEWAGGGSVAGSEVSLGPITGLPFPVRDPVLVSSLQETACPALCASAYGAFMDRLPDEGPLDAR